MPPLPDPTGDHIGNDMASNNNNNNTSNNNNTETLSGLQSEPELNNNNNNSGNQVVKHTFIMCLCILYWNVRMINFCSFFMLKRLK